LGGFSLKFKLWLAAATVGSGVHRQAAAASESNSRPSVRPPPTNKCAPCRVHRGRAGAGSFSQPGRRRQRRRTRPTRRTSSQSDPARAVESGRQCGDWPVRVRIGPESAHSREAAVTIVAPAVGATLVVEWCVCAFRATPAKCTNERADDHCCRVSCF
jgi:hypothetical protein